MQAQFGLTVIGPGAEEDTFTEEATGPGQELAALTYAAHGHIPTGGMHGAEGIGAKRNYVFSGQLAVIKFKKTEKTT